jgi:hypothetical protein
MMLIEPVITWLFYGIIVSCNWDTVPTNYRLTMDICKESNIRQHCSALEKVILGKNAAEVCRSMRIYLNESESFNHECQMIFANTNHPYASRIYSFYSLLHKIWLASTPQMITATVITYLVINGYNNVLINKYYAYLKAYNRQNQTHITIYCIASVLAIIILMLIIQGNTDYKISYNKETYNMRDIATLTCTRYYNDSISMLHMMYTSNSPIETCKKISSIKNWTQTQAMECIDIFAPTQLYYDIMPESNIWLTVFSLFMVYLCLRGYIMELAELAEA